MSTAGVAGIGRYRWLVTAGDNAIDSGNTMTAGLRVAPHPSPIVTCNGDGGALQEF